MRTTFEHLYDLGASTPDSVRPGQVTPAQAIAGIAAAGKLAQQLHVDIERSAVRPMFKRCWRQFYNRWIGYQALRASYDTMSDPVRVMDIELPNFLEKLQEWRNGFAQEPGGCATVTVGQSAKSGIPWKPILLLGAGAAVTLGVRWWWAARERQKVEERTMLDAARAQIAAGVVAPTGAPVMMPPPVATWAYPGGAWPGGYPGYVSPPAPRTA